MQSSRLISLVAARRRLSVAHTLFLSSLLLSSMAFAQRASGAISGRVVDADAGAPIAGAAVVAVWVQHIPAPHPVERFYDVREALTDAHGQFQISPPLGSYLPLGVAPPEIAVLPQAMRKGSRYSVRRRASALQALWL